MQLYQEWGGGLTVSCFENDASSRILNFLKRLENVVGTASEKGITIIQSRQNASSDEGFCGIFGKKFSDGTDSL